MRDFPGIWRKDILLGIIFVEQILSVIYNDDDDDDTSCLFTMRLLNGFKVRNTQSMFKNSNVF